MSIANKICEAAPRNTELLAILFETQHSPRDLDIQKSYITQLNDKLSVSRQRISQLDEKREAELRNHKSYRDSIVKKFAYRLSGQSDEFAARAQKGQQEYFDVLQQAQQAIEEESRLIAERDEAMAVQRSLLMVVDRHNEAQAELDALYDSIFHGPTPEFPEEDELERHAETAIEMYHCAALKSEKAFRLLATMKSAREEAARAKDEIVAALSGGHLAATNIEEKKLGNAQLRLAKMRGFVTKAQEISPNIKSLPPVCINIKLMSAEAYGNPWGRMAVHDRIREWRDGVQFCLHELDQMLSMAASTYADAQENARIKSEISSAIKKRLQSCRSEIFTIVESAEDDGRDGESPPPY